MSAPNIKLYSINKIDIQPGTYKPPELEDVCPSCNSDWKNSPPTRKEDSDYYDCNHCYSTFLRHGVSNFEHLIGKRINHLTVQKIHNRVFFSTDDNCQFIMERRDTYPMEVFFEYTIGETSVLFHTPLLSVHQFVREDIPPNVLYNVEDLPYTEWIQFDLTTSKGTVGFLWHCIKIIPVKKSKSLRRRRNLCR